METILTNLPKSDIKDSADNTKKFFNNFGQSGQEFVGADVDAAIGFLTSKGFGQEAAVVTASVLLKQAKFENIPIFKVLEQLKGFTELELSAVVSEILNQNRAQTSRLGYRVSGIVNELKSRNIKV